MLRLMLPMPRLLLKRRRLKFSHYITTGQQQQSIGGRVISSFDCFVILVFCFSLFFPHVFFLHVLSPTSGLEREATPCPYPITLLVLFSESLKKKKNTSSCSVCLFLSSLSSAALQKLGCGPHIVFVYLLAV